MSEDLLEDSSEFIAANSFRWGEIKTQIIRWKRPLLIVIAIALATARILISDSSQSSMRLSTSLDNSIIKTGKVLVIFSSASDLMHLGPIALELQKSPLYSTVPVYVGKKSSLMKQLSGVFNMSKYRKIKAETTESMWKLVQPLEKLLEEESPEMIMCREGSTVSWISTTIATHRHIPIISIDAGLFNNAKLSRKYGWYFSRDGQAYANLLSDGVVASQAAVVGNTALEAISMIASGTTPSNEFKKIMKRCDTACGGTCTSINFAVIRNTKDARGIATALESITHKQGTAVVVEAEKGTPIYQSLKEIIPDEIFTAMVKGEPIRDPNHVAMNRLILTPPMNEIDTVHMVNKAEIIFTDSSDIHELGEALGRRVLLTMDWTVRPMNAKLVGTETSQILTETESTWQAPEKTESSPSREVVAVIQQKRLAEKMYVFDSDGSEMGQCYDLVVILTVWKRVTLVQQLDRVINQSALKNRRSNIVIFHNGNHQDVSSVIDSLREPLRKQGIKLTYVHTEIETGYFGRFLMPLAIDTCPGAYWFVNDDDVLFGPHYYDNMIRVVNDGFLCGRVGRVLDSDQNNKEQGHDMRHVPRDTITFEEDLECDYVGQVWAGRIEWLRAAWKYPPIRIETSEDFWLSAVLKTKFGIKSKTPKCPLPVNGFNYNLELCACSLRTARWHKEARVSQSSIKDSIRPEVINNIISYYNFGVLKKESVDLYNKFRSGYNVNQAGTFNISGWSSQCWLWV